jgi:hypothetical protein
MITEKLVERELVGETEVLGENLFQCHFVHHICLYVCTTMGQRLALAPRSLMIYCASPFN